MKMKIASTFFALALLLGFVDQVDNGWALIEILNSSEFVIIDIKKAPCKVKEGTIVIIKNKKEITKCVK